MNFLAITTLLAFGFFSLAYILNNKRNLVKEAKEQLKSNLQKRYDLIGNMFKIVRVHVPEYGAMMETLITIRLDAAKKTDEKTSDEMNQEVFQMLYELINVPSYHTENDEDLRNEFKIQLMLIESNIAASQNFYISALRDYNKMALKLNLPKVDIYQVPAIKAATEEKKKNVLTLLDSMVG